MKTDDGTVRVDLRDAKLRLSELGERVWRGERVVIERAGRPYLDLTTHRTVRPVRAPGIFRGRIRMSEDFDATPEEVIADFEGDRTR